MSNKKIETSNEARNLIKKGVDIVADSVKTTLGPLGRNAVFIKNDGNLVVTNDGVTIAKEIELKDQYQNIGAKIVREAAEKTNIEAGDGTTTATVITQKIIDEGIKMVNSGVNAMELRNGLNKISKQIVAELDKIATKINEKDLKSLEDIAKISSQSDDIGKVVAEIVKETGKDGVVTIERGNKTEIEKEIVKGMKIDSGYVSPHLVDKDKMEIEIEEPVVFITDQPIDSINKLRPILGRILQSGKKEILLIAKSVERDALATIIINKLQGVANISAINAPDDVNIQGDVLEDIAVITGGKVVSADFGMKLEELDNLDSDEFNKLLGHCDKVKINDKYSLIVGGKGQKEEIDQRVKRLRELLEKADNNFAKRTFEERIAKFVSGVGVLRVGGNTKVEMEDRLYRTEDALEAAKAAIEEGIVPGGGVALLNVAEKLGKEVIGGADFNIMMKAIKEPIKQIAINSGIEDLGEHKAAILATDTSGYDFKTKKVLADSISEGVIDPVKVVKNAVVNATSAAATILTTNIAIVEDIEEKEKKE